MIKTLLATTGAVLMTVSALPAAPGGHSFAASRGGSPSFNRPAARVSPQYSTARRGYGYRGYRGGYYGGYGHRYYLYGVPYFYDPFFFGGFGYYGGFYGGYPYGYGYDNPYSAGYYNGRVTDDNDNDHNNDRANAAALPKAVQKQLSQRGYYKGSIDGEFGAGSRSALSRFQRDHNLRATGRIDPETMKALGFEERERD